MPLDPAYPRGAAGADAGRRRRRAVLIDRGALPASSPARAAVAAGGRRPGELAGEQPAPLRGSGARRAGDLAYVIYTSGSTGRPEGRRDRAPQRGGASSHWARRRRSAPAELAGVLAVDLVASTSRSSSCSRRSPAAARWSWRENALALAGLLAARRGGGDAWSTPCPRRWPSWCAWRAVPASVRTVDLAGEPLQRDAGATGPASCGAVERGCSTSTGRRRTRPTRPGCAGAPGARRADDRPADRRTRRAYVLDRGLRAGAARRAGRALPRRRGPRARLPRPAGADGRALRARPVRGRPAGARLYRTGDLARWLADGRARVPRAGSTTRSRCAASASSWARSRRRCAATRRCAEAAVVARESGSGRAAPGRLRRAAAEEADSGAGELRAYLRARLPAYMVPVGARACWRRCRSTPNGKVDRRALPAPRPGGGGARAGERPRRATPSRSCWPGSGRAARARAGRASTTTSSTSAATRCSPPGSSRGCARRFGVELPLRALLRGADRGRPGARVDAALRGGAAAAAAAARAGAAAGALAALLRPAAALVPDQLEPGSAAYNLPARRAARRAARRRPRSAAPSRESCAATRRCAPPSREARRRAGARCVAPAAPAPCRCRSSTSPGSPAGGRERRGRAAGRGGGAAAVRPRARAAAAGRAAAARRPASTRCSSPCTTSSPTAGRSACWSRELAALYAAFAAGRPLAAARAAGAVRRLRRLAARAGSPGEALEPQLAYWRERLAGAPPPLELPTDRPRPAVQAARRRAPAATWRPELAAALARRSPRREGATLFMALLAAFQALLAPLHRPGRTSRSARRSPAATGRSSRG